MFQVPGFVDDPGPGPLISAYSKRVVDSRGCGSYSSIVHGCKQPCGIEGGGGRNGGDQELKVEKGGMGDQEFKVILSCTSYPPRSNREQGISWPKKEEGATQAGAALC